MRPVKIITVEQSRHLENMANQAGVSFAQMMENAGRGTAEAIQQRFDIKNQRVIVLVGPGNNGGDGLVAAHHLQRMGAQVACYLWKPNAQGDPNLQRVCDKDIPVVWADEDANFCVLRTWLSTATVVVDALLGVGVARPIVGTLKDLLYVVRQATTVPDTGMIRPSQVSASSPAPRLWVVAVDCPSGLDCDTGALDPAALPADMTVTFAYPKVGLLRFPGAEAVGDLVVVDIGIPSHTLTAKEALLRKTGPSEVAVGATGIIVEGGWSSEDVQVELATAELVRGWLPQRPRSAHKGTFGRTLIVAGSVNYVGAAVLAGAGAMRVGAGLVTLALPMPILTAVAAHLTESTYLLLPHDLGVLSLGAVELLRKEMGDYDALLLGPGLSQERETVAFVHALLGLDRTERRGRIGFVDSSVTEVPHRPELPPLVIDADGLNALAKMPEWWLALPPETILTPHAGEMSRLMGDELTVEEIQSDREAVAERMAAKWNTVVVLKGAFTVVAAPAGRTVVMPFANPGLATAGSGDVLAGAIIGLRAQGMAAFESAVAGAYLHGLAGDLVRADLGDMGMVAGDLPPRLPSALRGVRQGGRA